MSKTYSEFKDIETPEKNDYGKDEEKDIEEFKDEIVYGKEEE